jgi:serine/threonine-protein kinase
MEQQYGRYQIQKELGHGTMGVVYLAHDPHIDRPVALKVLRADKVVSEEFVHRFLKEARAIGRLTHPNIVVVYDVGRDHGTIYIAMEYLEGSPFDKVIRSGKPDHSTWGKVGAQLADTLAYAHDKGIIHRDIKPSNIIMTQTGHIKLTDFGIARIEDPEATLQTRVGDILGTPAYMSPEQVAGQPVDGRSDLYSVGVILYEWLLGQRPFGGRNMAAIFSAIANQPPPPTAGDRPESAQILGRPAS